MKGDSVHTQAITEPLSIDPLRILSEVGEDLHDVERSLFYDVLHCRVVSVVITTSSLEYDR